MLDFSRSLRCFAIFQCLHLCARTQMGVRLGISNVRATCTTSCALCREYTGVHIASTEQVVPHLCCYFGAVHDNFIRQALQPPCICMQKYHAL